MVVHLLPMDTILHIEQGGNLDIQFRMCPLMGWYVGKTLLVGKTMHGGKLLTFIELETLILNNRPPWKPSDDDNELALTPII